jgi:teichuronic acid biosynthesis glycosyltransferase TuaG
MPAYNAEKYIGESINSVIRQTYQNWELVIVDDGSTDNTKQIIDRYKTHESRIKYIYQENGRQGKARNNGIRNSTGDFIAFLDADDLWDKNKLAIQINLIEQVQADLIYANCYLFDEDKVVGKTELKQNIVKGNEAIKTLVENNQIAILTVLCRRNIIEKVNGFTEKLDIQNAEDYHLWLRLLLAGYIFYSDDTIVAGYRQHAGAVTNDDKNATLPVVSALLDISKSYLEWSSVINVIIQKKLRNYLYNHNINNHQKVFLVLRQIHELKSPIFSFVIFRLIYKIAGERIFKKLLLKFL